MSKKKSIILWITALVLMSGVAIYQRMSGPSYPIKNNITISGVDIKYSLPRSHGGEGDQIIKIYAPVKDIKGLITYKRFKSFDTAITEIMTNVADTLIATLPHQPAAGKIQYEIKLVTKDAQLFDLHNEQVIIRFNSGVPTYILIPHIIFMFAALFLAGRVALEAAYKGDKLLNLSLWTTGIMFVGGLVLGPIVQFYAFGEFWTGWPWGHDLTDNKTIVSFLVWLFALYKVYQNKNANRWVLIAFFIMIAIYAIPHSVLGSEIDHTVIQKIK